MAAVAVVALDLGVWRGLWPILAPQPRFFLLGALPMAHILVVAALASRARPASRRFLVGFVASGTAAVAILLAWGWLFPESLDRMAMAVLAPIRESLGLSWEGIGLVILASAVLVVPQVAVALIGGLGFAVVRRAPSPPPA